MPLSRVSGSIEKSFYMPIKRCKERQRCFANMAARFAGGQWWPPIARYPDGWWYSKFYREINTQTIQSIGGSEALDEPYLLISLKKIFRKRGGWLVNLFIGKLLTATAMSFFEAEIAKAVVLWGSLSGSMLPFILKRAKLDPATSSAPFVATRWMLPAWSSISVSPIWC